MIYEQPTLRARTTVGRLARQIPAKQPPLSLPQERWPRNTSTSFAVSRCSLPHPLPQAQGKLNWTPDAKKAVVDAAEQKRVLFLSIGFVGEERSEAIRKSAFSNKAVIAQAAETINIPAWTWALGEEKKLPEFGEAEPFDHSANLAKATSEWLAPNSLDTIAVPQHVWFNADGEILVSCPWEISAEEMSWCFDEALRRGGMESRPAMAKGAHPPRRLLLGLVHEISGDDDLGRGLSSKEIQPIMEELKKGWVSMRNTEDLIRIMFSKDEDGVEFIDQQLGLWDFGGGAMSGIIDGTYGLVGMISPVEYLELLESKTEAPRDSLRATVAVAYEQMGRSEGLSAVKKALKREKSDFVRAEWVRALGACARGDKSTAKALIKLAEKDKDPRVATECGDRFGSCIATDRGAGVLARTRQEARWRHASSRGSRLGFGSRVLRPRRLGQSTRRLAEERCNAGRDRQSSRRDRWRQPV